MSVQTAITTLHDFLLEWLTDAGFRAEYDGDVKEALADHGFDDVDAADLLGCLPLVAEDLPLAYQQTVFDYTNAASTVDTGSGFTVNQGTPAARTGTNGYDGEQPSAHAAAHHSEQTDSEQTDSDDNPADDLDEVVQHIQNITYHITENHSTIDDRDVTTTLSAGGDIHFDQAVASGDGAVAAGADASGVNTGHNAGVIAGGDADVTNVEGDGNIFAADSTIVGGDFDGQFVDGNVSSSNLIGGDSGAAAAGGSSVVADDINVGGTQYDIDADSSAINFGAGHSAQDNSTHVDQSVNDSFNTDASVNDSLNPTNSFNDNSTNDNDGIDADLHDSFNDNSDNSTDIDDSFNTDESIDLDVELDDSLNDNSDHTVVNDQDVVDDSAIDVTI